MGLQEAYTAWMDEVKKNPASLEIDDIKNNEIDKEEAEKKKPKHPTKLLAVPALTFIQSFAEIRRVRYPLTMVLRGEKTDSSWKIKSKEELLEKIKIKELRESFLGYFETRDGMVYMEFLKDRKLVVKTEWLPGVFHGQEVFNKHMPALARLLNAEANEKMKEERKEEDVFSPEKTWSVNTAG